MKSYLRLIPSTLMILSCTGISLAQTATSLPPTSIPSPQIVPNGVTLPNPSTPPSLTLSQDNQPQSGGATQADATGPAAQKEAKDATKGVEIVDVQARPLRAFESFGGVLESTRTQEIKTDFETWTDLVVEQVVEQGAAVSPGKTLLKFKTETMDKALAEAEFAFKNAQFDLQKAELELKLANETFEMDKAQAERTWQEAQDDYQYYLNVELPNQLDDLAYGKKTNSYSFEYAKDELDQLEKMYLEDELTEESEAIVLKRAQRSVESAERYLKRNNLSLQREETTEIPRQKIAREMGLRKAEHEYRRAMITLPIAKDKAEIAFNQAKLALDEKAKKFEDLKSDRDKMEVKATTAGIVYYGQCENGKWSNRKLEVDQKVAENSVVMTVVDTSALLIRASLEETKLANLSAKLRGKAQVSALGNATLPVTINSIANISGDDGKYDCEIMIDSLPGGLNAMPGMACKLSFLSADREALMTKKASVFSDDDGVTHFVYVVEGDQVRRMDVVVGKTVGEDLEILEGLNAGSKIAKTRQ